MKKLGLEIPKYEQNFDPTKINILSDWTISANSVRTFKKLYNERCKSVVKKRKLPKIEKEEKMIKTEIKEEIKTEDNQTEIKIKNET